MCTVEFGNQGWGLLSHLTSLVNHWPFQNRIDMTTELDTSQLWMWYIAISCKKIPNVAQVATAYKVGNISINSLWPSDGIWRHISVSLLAQVIARCVAAWFDMSHGSTGQPLYGFVLFSPLKWLLRWTKYWYLCSLLLMSMFWHRQGIF